MTYYEYLFSDNKTRLLNKFKAEQDAIKAEKDALKNKIINNRETYDKYRNELDKEKILGLQISNLGSLGNHIEGAFKGVYHLNPYEVLSNTVISAVDLVGVAADVVSSACGVVSYAASQEKGTAVNAAFQAFVYSTLLAGVTFTVGAYVPMIAPAFNVNNALKAANIITTFSGGTLVAVGSVKAAYYIRDEAYSIAKNIVDTANYAATSVNNFAKDTVDTVNYTVTSVNNFAKDTVDTVNYVTNKVSQFANAKTTDYIADKTGLYIAANNALTVLDANVVQPFMHYVVDPVVDNPFGLVYSLSLTYVGEIGGNLYNATFNFVDV